MSWGAIRGHDAIRAAFARAIAQGRLAHGYLFVGPEGVGKRRFALELAKGLLCERPPEPLTACDTCPSCVQCDAGTHPDCLTVGLPEDKHEFPVRLVQEFTRLLHIKPQKGGRRVGIL